VPSLAILLDHTVALVLVSNIGHAPRINKELQPNPQPQDERKTTEVSGVNTQVHRGVIDDRVSFRCF
jgi:hypothetical protein